MTETATQRTGRITVCVTHGPIREHDMRALIAEQLRGDMARELAEILSDGRRYVVQWGQPHELHHEHYAPFSYQRMDLSALVLVADVHAAKVGEYVPESALASQKQSAYWAVPGVDLSLWEFRLERGIGWQRVK